MLHSTANLDRILLVDDDEAGRAALGAVLAENGYDVTTAGDGRAARALLEASTPDLIVLDVNLPDMTGFELFAQLRDREETREVPVLFVSGSTMDEQSVVRALSSGACDYLRRPFGAREFLARMEVALRQRMLLLEMKRLGTTDELTGLPNRRAFYEALERERRRAHREETDLSVVVIDIDRFKNVNDTHGHATGDRTLRAIAKVLRMQTRATDVAGRVGGEEFALVLPATSRAGAAELAEKLRREMAAVSIDLFDGRTLKVTASFGIASAPGLALTEFGSVTALMGSADAALYQAKRSGRDRVEISAPV